MSERRTSGYGLGKVDTVMSVDAVEDAAREMAGSGPDRETLRRLAGDDVMIEVEGLHAGYGRMEILHHLNLVAGRGQSLCLIGHNGAGKSTILHAIYGFADVMSGNIKVGGADITRMHANDKLKRAGVAYIMQHNSVFPNMTVEENLLMGGYLKGRPAEARQAAQRVFDKYDRLASRRHQRAGVLSGGERRLLEISRSLIMEPDILLVDEPSIGLEPRFIDMVFEILADLQQTEGKTIVMVEQNAKKGLEFADIGYVLVSGQLAKAGRGSDLLADEDVARLFLGG
jgi:branched-chain amino acid transport system ATP-binding protein